MAEGAREATRTWSGLTLRWERGVRLGTRWYEVCTSSLGGEVGVGVRLGTLATKDIQNW